MYFLEKHLFSSQSSCLDQISSQIASKLIENLLEILIGEICQRRQYFFDAAFIRFVEPAGEVGGENTGL